MRRYAFILALLAILPGGLLAQNGPGGFVEVSGATWNQAAVRRVLHTFAYGGFASDAQIRKWSRMVPREAVKQMLTFAPVNEQLSPVQDDTAEHRASLADLQAFLSSDAPGNPTCSGKRAAFAATTVRADGEVVLSGAGLQRTWIAAVNKRGLNPFRHKVGFWLVNYHMAVNLRDTSAPLITEHYDSALAALAEGARFHEVLAIGATSAAVAHEYGHHKNRFNNRTGVFTGTDDFAREFHQLFFRINGDLENPEYHENVTIEHTARVLTGLLLDKEPGAYGSTRPADWWVAPIDFSNHVDLTGRKVMNVRRHHAADLEILHTPITGASAEEKLFELASVAAGHPESIENLPVAIIRFFADDNLDNDKTAAIRAAWEQVARTEKDLLRFIRAYAASTAFHRADTYKFRTAFHRNMNLFNLNTVDNQESYGNSYTPQAVIQAQGGEAFKPVHDVFGGQKSLNAANSPDLFKVAHNSNVDRPDRLARTTEVCRDPAGNVVSTWNKDWAGVIPYDTTDGYQVKRIGRWLWDRFIADGGKNYQRLEKAHVAAFLARGRDLGYVVDSDQPGVSYSQNALRSEPLSSLVEVLEDSRLQLDSPVAAVRREANRRIGMAVSFVSMTPFSFAMEGR